MKQWYNKIFTSFGFICAINIILYAVIIICLYYTNKYNINNKESTSPVEEQQIEEIKEVNRAIIIEVETLDSIKDVKKIEVKNLDNDSTLKLFYELISK